MYAIYRVYYLYIIKLTAAPAAATAMTERAPKRRSHAKAKRTQKKSYICIL